MREAGREGSAVRAERLPDRERQLAHSQRESAGLERRRAEKVLEARRQQVLSE
jgi:hypothetical protein